ncbi:MAG: bifunctional hydroxymethylpyrimidine kinase/phosphomethylpyrimidine kinase [Candidatus Lokiarchaeota archaeon]|nr:bifunctional hydroxymethylpyrimidine kinase/phosphomethylpyrimidine kinase [Candidatus Lokiarchaeota archaeon]
MSKKETKPIVLTVAGHDPSSGAGLTADIRTFENVGVYGMSICTAITIQNAEKVFEWQSVDINLVKKQFNVIFDSYEIKAVKTGMLGSKEVINLVKEYKENNDFTLVVDPIIMSGSGTRLADENYEDQIMNKLFPVVDVITVNKFEAELFSKKTITDVQSIQDVGAAVYELGPKNIIIKGGHIEEKGNKVLDYLYGDYGFSFYPRERVQIFEGTHIHGTGCIFSSLITGFLGLEYDLEESIFLTEDFMEDVFQNIFPLKQGQILDVGYSGDDIRVLKQVQKVVAFITENPNFSRFIPEVRTNIAISKPTAKSLDEIAGIEGRITVVNGLPRAAGPIKFGANNHTGRLLLTAKKLDNEINAVINIKYDPNTILNLKDTRLIMMDVDRLKQNKQLNSEENTTMGWIVREAYDQLHKIPDIIWDNGEKGKEPMIRLFARTSDKLIQKLKLFLNLV